MRTRHEPTKTSLEHHVIDAFQTANDLRIIRFEAAINGGLCYWNKERQDNFLTVLS